MSREVLFVAGMADTAREIPVFRQLAGPMTATQCEVSYIDGVRQQGEELVALTPEEQAATISARVAEIIDRNPRSAFRLIAHGLGALPTVHFLAAEHPDLDATAFLISPWDVSAGNVDSDTVNRNTTHEKASIIMPHLEQLGAFSQGFATELEELSDVGSLKVVYVTDEWNNWSQHSSGLITRTVPSQDVMHVAGSPAVPGGLDTFDVKRLFQAVIYR